MSRAGGSGNRWEPRDGTPAAEAAAVEAPGPSGTAPSPLGSRRRERGLLGALAAVCLLGGGLGGYAVAPGAPEASRPDRAGVSSGPGQVGRGQVGPGSSEPGQPPGGDGRGHDGDGYDGPGQERRT